MSRCVPSEPCGNCDHCATDLLAGLRTGAWLDAQVFPPLSWAVPGIIAEGSTLLVGPPKIGKSWLVLSMALGVAAGGRVLSGIAVEARPVLYLALEDGHRRLQERARQLLEGDPIPAGFEYITALAEPGSLLATVEAWLERHPDTAPLIIVDTLGKVMPAALMGESSYQRDYRVGSSLKRLADSRPGCALVIIHHDRKAQSDDFVDAVSGTHGLAGAADTIVVLHRARHEQTGVLKVTGRDVSEGEYAIVFDSGSRWKLDGANLTAAAATAATRRSSEGLDERSRQIIQFVTAHPDGVGAAEVASAVGIDAHQARTYLSRLAEGDRIERVTRGRYGPPPHTPVASVALLRSTTDGTQHATQATPLWGEE